MLLNTLTCLPKNLEAIYDQILDRMDGREMVPAKTILQWLVLGMRALTIGELSIAVMFDVTRGKFDSSLALVHPDVVIQVCSSLVTKADDNTVQLAHASVKEYFLSKPRFKNQIALFDTETGHALIAHCCMRYILDWLWHDSIGYLDWPLLDYSAEFWPHHYKLSNRNSILQNIAMSFFQTEPGIWYRWAVLHQAYFLELRVPIHFAAHYGLEDVLEKLIINNTCFTECNKALSFAATNGHIGVVKLLLKEGIDLNAQGGEYGTALQAASYTGHYEVVILLMQKGADASAQGGQYGNALQAASFGGHRDIVTLLLDKAVDVNAQGGFFGNALQAASCNGNVEIATLLLDKGADVNAQGGEFGNALHAASSNGHSAVVLSLLKKGADVHKVENITMHCRLDQFGDIQTLLPFC